MDNQISKSQLFMAGILGWGIFSIIENVVSALFVGKYLGYYLLSFSLWLLLGLLASLLLYYLAMFVGHVGRRERMAPIQVLSFVVLAPAWFYSLIQVSGSLPGSYYSLPNIFLDALALVIFVFVAIFLCRAWRHRKINLLDGVAYNLLFGGLGVSGTLLVACELQPDHWPLKAGSVLVFCAVIPSVLAVLLNRAALVRKFISILVILVLSTVLEERLICPLIQNQAFVQAKNNENRMIRAQENATNIILIVADTLRAKNMSAYGYKRETTPNLDLFCQDAVKFLDAVSSAPWTLPSHASLFTGYLSHIHGANHGEDRAKPELPLSEGFDTLAELLVSAGYETAAVVANQAHLAPWTGLNQGFDYYWWGRSRDEALLASFLSSHLPKIPKRWREQVNKFCGFDIYTSAGRINQLALRWLKSKKSRPFFTFINYMETHDRAYLPPRFSRLFTLPPGPSFPEKNKNTGYPITTPGHIDRIRSWYDNEVACIDSQISSFIGALKKINAYEGTLIIVTSDHGELLGEHEDFGHESWLYNELLAVPLIVKYPFGRCKNSKSEKPVQNIDVFAEILDVAKIEIPDGVQGQPFHKANHPIISEERRDPAYRLRWPERYDQDLEAIIPIENPQFKLIRSTRGKVELFSRRDDPEEMYDIKDEAKKQEILEQFNSYLMALNPIRQKYEVLKDNATKMDATTRERLRALGYIK